MKISRSLLRRWVILRVRDIGHLRDIDLAHVVLRVEMDLRASILALVGFAIPLVVFVVLMRILLLAMLLLLLLLTMVTGRGRMVVLLNTGMRSGWRMVWDYAGSISKMSVLVGRGVVIVWLLLAICHWCGRRVAA